VLLGLLGLQFATPFDAELPESTMVVPRHALLGPKPKPEAYPEILLRPIFAPDRLPMMEVMPGYSLLGIGIAGPSATAIVQGPGGRMLRVRPGDRLAGWPVASITPNNLFFQRNKERRMLKLDMSRLYNMPGKATQAGQPKAIIR
jgi:hypothetical protein